MNRSRVAGFALVAALGLLLVLQAIRVARNSAALRPVGGGQEAPAFTVRLLDGGSFTLAPGKVTLIDFWATWCAPCRAELPRIDDLWKRERARGVQVIAVNAEGEDAIPAVKAFAREKHLELPIGLDGEDAAARYKVENLPQIVVVDASGRIRKVLLGMRSESTLEEAVDGALEP